MKLNLKRPLIFFDLETTGLDAKDKIVEISLVKVFPSGEEETYTTRVNPEMPIPPESSAIHGITDEDVKDCPTFKEIAPKLIAIFRDCDVAGYNSGKFDLPFLDEAFAAAGIKAGFSDVKHIDVQNIFHKMERRTLEAAVKFYCNKELDNAHSAEADATATYEVLKAQLDRYPNDLKNDVDFLANFSKMHNNIDLAGRFIANDKGEAVFNFGKYKGQRVVEVLQKDPNYYDWMIKSDFSVDTKNHLTRIRLGGEMYTPKSSSK